MCGQEAPAVAGAGLRCLVMWRAWLPSCQPERDRRLSVSSQADARQARASLPVMGTCHSRHNTTPTCAIRRREGGFFPSPAPPVSAREISVAECARIATLDNDLRVRHPRLGPRNPADRKAPPMPYARTSLRKEKRGLREKMRAMGLDYRDIAAEFGRRYRLRPRAAWREAYGWSLQQTADRINESRGDIGLDPGAFAGMTAPHLCEHENWPARGASPPAARRTASAGHNRRRPVCHRRAASAPARRLPLVPGVRLERLVDRTRGGDGRARRERARRAGRAT